MPGFLTRGLIYAALAAVIAAGLVGYGYHLGINQLWEYQAAQARAAVVVVKKIELVKEIVRVDRVRREVQIQQVFVEIEKESSNVPSRPSCSVTAGWMRSHDAAADGGDRREPGGMDDETDTGIAETAALAEIRSNYKSFHQVASDLKSCRAFVDAIGKVK